MRKLVSSLPSIDVSRLFPRRKSSTKKDQGGRASSDQEKLRKSARKTLQKYKKTFRKLAYE